MEKKSKKSLVIGITSLFLVTLILLGLTYAYYRTRIIGNELSGCFPKIINPKTDIKIKGCVIATFYSFNFWDT